MTDYRNRIKALEYVNSSDLTPHPGNWREHPAAQAEALKGVLNEVGIAGALLAYRSQRQGGALVVIDGHLRKDAAPQKWPVLILDVDDSEADFLLATHDPLAAMATADAGALDALLSSVQSGEAAVQQMLAELAEDAGLYQPKDTEDAEPQVDRVEELREQWGVKPGQLWRLPSRTPGQEHRLICGDCTDAAVVERVMGGERAEMVWTDPPYGVSVGNKNKYLNSIAPSNRIEDNLQNDTLDEAGLIDMLCRAFDNVLAHCTAGAAWHVAAPAGPLHVLFGQVLKDRGLWRQTIQWVKNNATFSPLGVDYHWRAEPIFYGWVPNAAHRYYGGRKQDTVWEIDRPSKSPEHPTMKPVELVQRAIENHSRSSEVVCDPFLGSGTTLIAAENLSRQCRAVEISPGYVAVALERYAAAFNIEPELIT